MNAGHAYFERDDNQNAPEVNDAYAVVTDMVACADLTVGSGPAWFGWAIREAYLRGVIAERERCARVAEERACFHRDNCAATCKCADGWHIAMAIRSGTAAGGGT